MKSFVLADVNKDIKISIAKKEFNLKAGYSYRFNYATDGNIKDVLKFLAKHKGVFRYIETNSFINCYQTFSLAKERNKVESNKLSNNFKGRKNSTDNKLIKAKKDIIDEERGNDYVSEDVISTSDSDSINIEIPEEVSNNESEE